MENQIQVVTELEGQSEELLDEIEIEEYGKQNRQPPKAKRYIIRIDKQKYTVQQPTMTGRELLQLAGKQPVERHALFLKTHGGGMKEIMLNESVDLTAPGVERFTTVTKDTQEG